MSKPSDCAEYLASLMPPQDIPQIIKMAMEEPHAHLPGILEAPEIEVAIMDKPLESSAADAPHGDGNLGDLLQACQEAPTQPQPQPEVEGVQARGNCESFSRNFSYLMGRGQCKLKLSR